MNRETPEQTTRRLGDTMQNDIAETVARIYASMNRQASDGVAFVVIGLFVATAELLLRIFVEN